MKCAVIVFPGSNCDRDAFHVLKYVFGLDCQYVFHEDSFPPDEFDLIVLPGGFSFGDYLRAGAIARFSPVMGSVREAVNRGKFVLGICNGFQILTESKLLPGALLRNKNLRFICRDVFIKVVNNRTPFTCSLEDGQILRMPIAHGEGRYFIPADQLKGQQIVFQYCDERGSVNEDSNPNGSCLNIAGVINDRGNVLGMMPHPERCCEEILGNTDGKKIFESLITHLTRRKEHEEN
ncbi:MAG: phosphoribosylformylglycinamidine synthase I [Pseudothermotoga sp.]|nr:phosphoribosylformylglycinamidine synthase I [Pseudothermotoga sp.]